MDFGDMKNRLQITTRVGCRVACAYCPQDKLIKAYHKRDGDLLMSIHSYRRYLESVPLEVEIWFAGMCEPWLNPQCTEMVLHANEKGHTVSVFTTLVGLDASDVPLLESVNYGFFNVHLPSASGMEDIPTADDYLATLNGILQSNINASYHSHSKNVNSEVKRLLDNYRRTLYFGYTYQRSGNVRSGAWLKLPRRRGAIACKRNWRNNVLLPNGDVLLCSQDYGMKHILGNLNSSSYDSLSQGSEFLRIRKGHKDGATDILCRHCEEFCRNVDLVAKVCNFPYLLDKCLCHLKGIRSYGDLRLFINTVFDNLRAPFRK